MTRRSARRGEVFQPDLLQGHAREAVNAAFLQDAAHWRLQFRCEDCCNHRSDGSCLYGWPRPMFDVQPFEVVDVHGEANFCRAFEPLGS